MAGIMELARSLGNGLARTDEYQAMRKAVTDSDDDRDFVELRSTLQRLEEQITADMRAGKEPEKEVAEEYETAVARMQALPVYQRLVAAQANFDKLFQKVNAEIGQGMEEAAESKIILAP